MGDEEAIYSFCDGKVKERMRDHIRRALFAFNVNSRIVRYGNSIDPKFFEKLKLAIIFHDFGKLIIKKINSEGVCTFPGHETVSGFAVYEYMRVMKYNDIDSYQVALAVMLHHHPMNLEKRLEVVKNEFRNRQIRKEHFYKFFNEMEGVIDNNMKLSRDQIDKIFNGSDNVSVGKAVNDAVQIFKEGWMKVWMMNGRKEKRVLLLLIQGLVASDYFSAKERGGVTGFNKVVEEFVNINNNFTLSPH